MYVCIHCDSALANALHSSKIDRGEGILYSHLPHSPIRKLRTIAALSACRSIGSSNLMYVCIHCDSALAGAFHSSKIDRGKGILYSLPATFLNPETPDDCGVVRVPKRRILMYVCIHSGPALASALYSPNIDP
jgi:hypothetical protein